MRDSINDARVQLAVTRLSTQESNFLKAVADLSADAAWGHPYTLPGMLAILRLLDKGLIKVIAEFETGDLAYTLTPLGGVVAQVVKSALPRVKAAIKEDQPE
jgi:hypothetical protein